MSVRATKNRRIRKPPPKDAAVHRVITPKERLALPLLARESRLVQIQSYPLKLGDKTFNLSLADIIYDSPKGNFPHPQGMLVFVSGLVYDLPSQGSGHESNGDRGGCAFLRKHRDHCASIRG
jgi:hypothetical protein